jgi:hypothetical protein
MSRWLSSPRFTSATGPNGNPRAPLLNAFAKWTVMRYDGRGTGCLRTPPTSEAM